jgi:hypothetical protein
MCESHINSSFISLDASSMCETASPSPLLEGSSASSPRLRQPPCRLDIGGTPDLLSPRCLSPFGSPFMASEVEGWRQICSPDLRWSFSAHGQRGLPDLFWSSLMVVLRSGFRLAAGTIWVWAGATTMERVPNQSNCVTSPHRTALLPHV